ncbi:hypothetical protein XU18_4890 [Perkinsela sp. CCAP 1560/4]|nr:hypothetical protein XU18_4890 [Perkinsela sp. CCAP 1560/4]|eukprot:KNH03814.1 hypothetical protein XU18_4890 [Perkinsela sp. CCAP 1560/4]
MMEYFSLASQSGEDIESAGQKNDNDTQNLSDFYQLPSDTSVLFHLDFVGFTGKEVDTTDRASCYNTSVFGIPIWLQWLAVTAFTLLVLVLGYAMEHMYPRAVR